MTSAKVRVLVFPCGSEPALEIHTALQHAVNVQLFGASSRKDHGEFVYRRYIGNLPYLSDPDFLRRFNQILRAHQIDVVFATHDTVALFLSANRRQLEARLCVGDERTVELSRNKADLYAAFAAEPFCPFVFGDSGPETFPVFLKPAVDEGGKGGRLVRDADEMRFFASRMQNPILMEYLPGDEYTVDCFTDRHGELRFFGLRSRERVWAGISVRSTTQAPFSEVTEISRRLNELLGFRGLWFFQLKRDAAGRLKILEVSSRVAGSMSLYRVQGVNLPLLTVYDAMDKDVIVAPNTFDVTVERALLNRYRIDIEYEVVYVDLDDTLICNERVNSVLLSFLYQARAEGKRLVLITKHDADLSATLARFAIAPALFDDIRHLDELAQKSTQMTGQRAIFIDNAFAERVPVMRLGIPVFDVDAVHALIDWRA